jgi:hypothetical protein
MKSMAVYAATLCFFMLTAPPIGCSRLRDLTARYWLRAFVACAMLAVVLALVERTS